jgi:hypothetical protein
MSNLGSVPAKNFLQRSHVVIAPNPLPDGFIFPPVDKPWAVPISLFRGDDLYSTATASRLFNANELAEIVAGTAGLYIYAECQYDDGFGATRETKVTAMAVGGTRDALQKLTSNYEPEDLKISFHRMPGTENSAT